MKIEQNVIDRYARAAETVESALCCPVSYDPRYLEAIPQEILDRDYGCGDPSRHVRRGDTVLDLGSGGGKICFIASQIVGPEGKVIGVDFNPAMLSLAKQHQAAIAACIGWNNVTFLRGRIQDLQTDYDRLDRMLADAPVSSSGDYIRFVDELRAVASAEPMIADESVDVIVSNCVLNLVRPEDKRGLFSEMMRVLKPGGRVAISDIVSDEEVPAEILRDPDLWSGCIAGAFQEQTFLKAFAEAGFYGVTIDRRDENPWRTIRGIEFRAATVLAYKGKEGPCLERNQAVIYKGPWREVRDDDGHIFRRGVPTAVCDKTFRIMGRAPYGDDMIPVEPRAEVPPDEATVFDCRRSAERSPSETKGADYSENLEAAPNVCAPGKGCC